MLSRDVVIPYIHIQGSALLSLILDILSIHINRLEACCIFPQSSLNFLHTKNYLALKIGHATKSRTIILDDLNYEKR